MTLPARLIAVIVAIVSSGLSSQCFADQPGASTISSSQTPIIVDGKLKGCEIGFEVGRDDPEFSHGETVLLRGVLVFMTYDGKPPAFALKLGVKTVGAKDFQRPAEAYLLNGATTNAADYGGYTDSPELGFRVFGFRPGSATFESAINSVADREQFNFTYAMKAGEISAVVPVDLTVRKIELDPLKSKIDHEVVLGWGRCLSPLLRNMIKNEARLPFP